MLCSAFCSTDSECYRCLLRIRKKFTISKLKISLQLIKGFWSHKNLEIFLNIAKLWYLCFSQYQYRSDILFLAGYICKMKNIKKLIVIEGILFPVAGIITVLVGKFTVDRYGTILLLCGVVAMAIGVVSQAGSRHRPMPYSYRPEISVSEQHLRDKKDMQSNITFFFKSFIVGIIPVVIGLILMYLLTIIVKTKRKIKIL